MKKKIFITMISLVLLVFGITTSVNATKNTADVILYDNNLLNYTNTFNGELAEKTTLVSLGSNETYKYSFPNYSISNTRNGNIVSKDAPKITFITHGLGGSFYNWLQKEHFKGSVIDQLNQVTSCDFYGCKITYVNNIMNCVWKKIVCDSDSYVEQDINKLNNSSRHIVILFSASDRSTWNTNDYVYSEFNYMASVAIKQVKDYDPTHALPKVNLIGHSRGGLTNLQFALDHPDLVDSMYSLGTPYLGTTSASIHEILYSLSIDGGNYSVGEADIIDDNTFNEYYNRWNENYDLLYNDINVLALGGYSDIDYLLYCLGDYGMRKNNLVLTKEEYTVIKNLLITVYSIYLIKGNVISKSILMLIVSTYLTSLVTNNLSKVLPALEQNEFLEGIINLAHFVIDEIDFKLNKMELEIYNDICVDLDSQLGKDSYLNTV